MLAREAEAVGYARGRREALADASEDAARLDWVDAHRLIVQPLNQTEVVWSVGPLFGGVGGRTLREAIDAARTSTRPTERPHA